MIVIIWSIHIAQLLYKYSLLCYDETKAPKSATLQPHNKKLFRSSWKQVDFQHNFEDSNR